MELASARALKEELSAELDRIAAGEVTPLMEMMSATMDSRTKALAPYHLVPHGVALGVAVGSEIDDYRLALRIQVQSPASTSFTSYAVGLARNEADVRSIGLLTLGRDASAGMPPYCEEVRPIKPGYSIGHPIVGAGTIGALVEDQNGRHGILSNSHILAVAGLATKRDNILQPGALDGGREPANVVASLERFVSLERGRGGSNVVDAAYALLKNGVRLDPTYDGKPMQRVVPARELAENMNVWKLGRSTGKTRGKVSVVNCDNLQVRLGGVIYSFDDQLEVESDSPFSQEGDSGAVVLNDKDEGIGLLLTGSERGGSNGKGLTYANPLETVLKNLKLKPL
ncbi:hypothetical protein [Hyalangium minutum]|uniref:Peptidase S1 domain-containing protein n=1 Tax=Hyalangium minutum TaxID=394096 RepID=A0A085VZ42_9BACT|nr:hypothetical protein [Hyalangium minutum]KFE58467.1 hypothetical protein DB31_6733 [Hyalangium minutum]KFE60705.1 hypothetical protein DB31_4887 [Hyalangium minutum]